jgi:hypothetical protein
MEFIQKYVDNAAIIAERTITIGVKMDGGVVLSAI